MENQTPEVIAPQQSKSNHILWVVIGVAILAVGVGIGLAVGKYFQPISSSTSSPTVVLSPTPFPTTALVEAVDPTANWKTYTNTKYAYSIKIPPEWGVDSDPSIILTEDEFQKQDYVRWLGGTGWGTYFTIGVLKSCTSNLKQCFAEVQKEDKKTNGPYSPSITTFETSIFLGSEAIIAHSRQMFPPPKTAFRGIFLIHAGKLWLFETHTSLEIDKKPEVGEQETDQILSTFKFLDIIGKHCLSDADCTSGYRCMVVAGTVRVDESGKEIIPPKTCYPKGAQLPQ